MHLLRVQVPDFRGLKNIDITFEKDFFPRIFPLGSLNGGGKSTLLQLIFVLLHCSVDDEKKPFLQNLLQGFQVADEEARKTLAIIDIWHEQKIIQIVFFACEDAFIKRSPYFLDTVNNTEDQNYISFSSVMQFKVMEKQVADLKLVNNSLTRSSERLDTIKNIEDNQQRFDMAQKEFNFIQQLVSNSRTSALISVINSKKDVSIKEIQSFQDEIKQKLEEVENNLDNLKNAYERAKRVWQKIIEYLQTENMTYICNFSSEIKSNTQPNEALLCQLNNTDIKETHDFLKILSEKIFLSAPSTQVFLFLDRATKELLFKGQTQINENYFDKLQKSKFQLQGFFTYDFMAVDSLLEAFKAARDKDFKEAIETDKYGNNYQTLVNELRFLLNGKKININKDLSGITLNLEKNGETIELYPEDLSHGELKRLSIYIWLKSRDIEDAIVLMDEIEIAFHPDWQYQIISDLKEWAPSNQYILATHSYELCQALTPAHVKEIEPKLIKQESESEQ
ncbi:MAG: ATP-binding protein [Oscillatoriaceae cyanobacterium Prado104]|jgi:predicted ATPase|nr:ATP-binding protein [Oscillatoriaceae cyanobacterium Prado104]